MPEPRTGNEDIVFHVERGDLVDIPEHPKPSRYAGPRIFVVRREDCVYPVPFAEDEHTVFLKTIIPSRKATKPYLGPLHRRWHVRRKRKDALPDHAPDHDPHARAGEKGAGGRRKIQQGFAAIGGCRRAMVRRSDHIPDWRSGWGGSLYG